MSSATWKTSGPFLIDTSVLIDALRRRPYDPIFCNASEPQWLSVVVVSELLAGARPAEAAVVLALYESYARFSRIVTPRPEDWIQCGHVLSSFGRRFGYDLIGRSRITNDTLIALGASRLGLTVVTSNRKDFERLAELIPFRWELI